MARLGIVLENACPTAALAAAAKEAEATGIEAFFVVEGLGRDGVSQVAALACHTRTIRLGTAILPVFTRSATLLAMTTASLAELTGGRFILGLGTGAPLLLASHGISVVQPRERLRDYVHIIRRAVAGETVSYQGQAAQVENLRLWFSLPGRRVPIYLAGHGPQLAELAGQMADGVIMHMVTPEEVRRLREDVARGARLAGRRPEEIDVACFVICTVSVGKGRAREALAQRLSYFAVQRFYQARWRRAGLGEEGERIARAFAEGGTPAAAAQVSDRLLEALPVAADADSLRHKIRTLREAGVDLPLLYPNLPDPANAAAHIRATLEAALA